MVEGILTGLPAGRRLRGCRHLLDGRLPLPWALLANRVLLVDGALLANWVLLVNGALLVNGVLALE